jgi:hypothetical protein
LCNFCHGACPKEVADQAGQINSHQNQNKGDDFGIYDFQCGFRPVRIDVRKTLIDIGEKFLRENRGNGVDQRTDNKADSNENQRRLVVFYEKFQYAL